LSVFVMAAIAAGLTMVWLKRVAVDIPGGRSNHTEPTPTGVGIALMGVVWVFLMITGMSLAVRCALLVLVCISFWDDLKGVEPRWRLLAQCVAIALSLTSLEGPIFGEFLP